MGIVLNDPLNTKKELQKKFLEQKKTKPTNNQIKSIRDLNIKISKETIDWYDSYTGGVNVD